MVISNRYLYTSLIILTAFLYLLAFTSFTIQAIISVTIFIFAAYKFIYDLGKNFSIKGLILLIASAQWLLAPVLNYYFPVSNIYYRMFVPEIVYLPYALLGTFTYFLFLLIPISKDSNVAFNSLPKRVNEYLNIELSSNVGIWIVTVGVVASFIDSFLPSSLAFLFYILRSFRFIGAYYLLLSNHKYRIPILVFVMGWLLLESINYGMFHDLVLWVAFLFIIILIKFRIKMWQKLAAMFLAVFFLLALQSIKSDYRNNIWYGGSSNKAEVFYTMLSDRITNVDLLFNPLVLDNALYRLNQGWIIAAIMRWVPYGEPYAEGETISTALKGSLLPRFLAPDKIQAGGHSHFERFTGQYLPDTVSMNLSVLGEAYANYSFWGGIVFMAIFGFSLNLIITRIYKYSITTPTIVLWMPLLMQEFVKAENDFSTGINHFVKSALVVFFVFWFCRYVIKVKI
ncbi:hypothetical protein ABID22_001529 [Pontibacter aydingkolensis]|uniref:Oligosaccharide repeat unit polymerase n=1 Tax=Pontibacter aydingkolensis TaxID=1911536 RepID=A0ABS7CTW0_9BACT|nr:hypothetical protein [Pontibacter aydingkolensis]MBW7467203.1 hypothetical protein [Pontibacter aydingkolensis]